VIFLERGLLRGRELKMWGWREESWYSPNLFPQTTRGSPFFRKMTVCSFSSSFLFFSFLFPLFVL